MMNYVATLHRQIDGMIRGFVQLLPQLAISLIILLVTWGVANLAVRIVGGVTSGSCSRRLRALAYGSWA
jgi:small conductance mechanosensitive channel